MMQFVFAKVGPQNLPQKRSLLALFSQNKITPNLFVHLLTQLYHYKPFKGVKKGTKISFLKML